MTTPIRIIVKLSASPTPMKAMAVAKQQMTMA
ncbi:MAG: hypothetical protein FD152_4414 [Xanthobacteraceae bacterium]|nr:MAG: hypothetical protein FD152_4414 [Xanthobacteraceae bacterium]